MCGRVYPESVPVSVMGGGGSPGKGGPRPSRRQAASEELPERRIRTPWIHARIPGVRGIRNTKQGAFPKKLTRHESISAGVTASGGMELSPRQAVRLNGQVHVETARDPNMLHDHRAPFGRELSLGAPVVM